MSRVLPILFNTEMVRAILDGRKTVTRRVIRGKITINEVADHKIIFFPYKPRKDGVKSIKYFTMESFVEHEAPYQPGDILYIRETWAQVGDIPHWNEYVRTEGNIPVSPLEYVYKADNMKVDGILPEIKWHPSIHMPKEAARIWLKVTDVRVERLRDTTDESAKKEGFSCRDEFIQEFLKIYPECTEESWLWVIEFERCDKPESEG